ncbi:hypothetical protein BV133_1928 [Blastochloris viridis]|uniref:Uncharacterized protein n=1 Tax=Blastochloris viridis TaxID=1079 RepID=A0A182D3N4_BLAVI|nr:hypothetical protein BV133_1928 [Blastochloris viridis]
MTHHPGRSPAKNPGRAEISPAIGQFKVNFRYPIEPAQPGAIAAIHVVCG